ncbi:MAG: YncE family protein, partial [Candidatus Nanopusillus acidilobi]
MKGRKFIGILLAFLMFASIFAIVSFTGNAMGSGENTVIATLKVGKFALGMAYDPQNGYIYVTNEYSNNITVINGATNSIITNIALPSGSGPIGIAYNPQNGYLYVADDNNPRLIVINPSTNSINTVALPSGFYSNYVLYDPDNGYLYISGSNLGGIIVFNPSTNQTTTISVGNPYANPLGMVYDSDNKYLYVGDDANGNIYVINTQNNTLVKTFNINGASDFAVYDPYNKYVYVSNPLNNIVYVINTTSNTFAGKNITSGLNIPEGLVINPINQYLYIANWDNITVINPSTNTQVISISTILGGNGYYLLYDPANKYIYETERFGSTTVFSDVEVIKTVDFKYTVAFTETGLPNGTLWYVNLSNGQTFSSTNNTITINEPNGTYSFTVATVNKSYKSPDYSSPNSGTFTVNGANVNFIIRFVLITYTITFNENGLGGIYGFNKW